MTNRLLKAATGFFVFLFGWPVLATFLFLTCPLFAVISAFSTAKACYDQNAYPFDLKYAEENDPKDSYEDGDL